MGGATRQAPTTTSILLINRVWYRPPDRPPQSAEFL